MEGESQTLSVAFADAEKRREDIDSAFDTNAAAFQENVTAAIAAYERCLKISDHISLFSPNESLEDVSSKDLQYFLINYNLAELLLKHQQQDRSTLLRKAQMAYEAFLKLLDQYDIMSRDDGRLLERWKENPELFSTASTTDAARRRETKIARFKQDKELRRKLEARSLVHQIELFLANCICSI